MRISVRTSSSRHGELPSRILLGPSMQFVVSAVERGEENGARCFNVELMDGRRLVLLRRAAGCWELAGVSKPGVRPAPSRVASPRRSSMLFMCLTLLHAGSHHLYQRLSALKLAHA